MPELLFFPDREHGRYTWDGKPVISVTQVFDRIAIRESPDTVWLSIAGTEFMQRDGTGSRFGTLFHEIAKQKLRGHEDLEYDERIQPWVGQFDKFRKKHLTKKVTNHPEIPVYSTKFNYAGCPDDVAIFENGKIIVPDWKTSESINKLMYWQVAGYAQAVKEYYEIKKDIDTWIVKFKANSYRIYERCGFEVKSDFNKFLSCLNLVREFTR